jgi:hypothetical protein
MALTTCPDCNNSVSTSAASCPHCGCPIAAQPVQHAATDPVGGRRCPHCKSHQVGKVRGMQGVGEVLVCMALLCLGLIPGIIYYIHRESLPYCSGCGRRV